MVRIMEITEYIERSIYEFIIRMGFNRRIILHMKLLNDPMKFIKNFASRYNEILIIGEKRLIDSLAKALDSEKSKFILLVDDNLVDKIIIFWKG